MPLFEVPYEMPFIAITEQAARRLINEQYDVVDTRVEGSRAARAAGDRWWRSRGDHSCDRRCCGRLSARGRSLGLAPSAEDTGRRRGRAGASPFPGPHGGAPPAGVPPAVVSADRGELGDFERLIARQASIVVGLELMRERVVNETERRLAGDLLADALSGRLDAEELVGRLRPFGIRAEASVLVFSLDDPPAAEAALEAHLARVGVPALVATASAAGRHPALRGRRRRRRRCDRDVARDARKALIGTQSGPARGGQPKRARLVASPRLSRSALRARGDLASRTAAVPRWPRIATLARSPCCLRFRTTRRCASTPRACSSRSAQGEGEYGGELLRSLEAFIENNGNWERAARQLYCHRHTLRYRIRKIEELTGRDLSRATDRIELGWHLRARRSL